MKKTLLTAVMTLSTLAMAAPPSSVSPSQGTQPSSVDKGAARWGERAEERREEIEKHMRLMMVVGIADALNLNETDAIRLADKIKVFEDKRKPLREQMHDSMKVLKAAADGDASALGRVDQATMTVLDTRAQMAAVDKEMFLTVSKDLTPQKRAQLALFMAKFMHEAQGKMMRGPGERGGRRSAAQ
jgi:hypothetical protein